MPSLPLGGELISPTDTFSVSWNTTYDTAFNFEAQFVIECYASASRNATTAVMATASYLKSIAQLSFKRGEDISIRQQNWNIALVMGQDNMRDFIREIVIESMHLSLEDADEVLERLEETLNENTCIENDPRLN